MIDEEKTITRTLMAFAIIALLGSLLILVSSLIQQHGQFVSASGAALAVFITCLVVLQLLRVHQLTILRIILPAIIYLIATYLIFTGENVGIHDEAVLLYSLVVSLAGLLLGKRGVVIFSILSVLAVGASIHAEIIKIIGSQTTTYDTLIAATIIYSTAFSMMYILVSILTNNLEKVRLNQRELTLANQELQNIRASLELQVQERTIAAENARSEALAAQKAAETQTWLVTGQAQLAEQIRGDLDLDTLANNIIQHICHYTNALAGAFFLTEGQTLRLMGRYAYTENIESKNIIRLGEGLIGQAAQGNAPAILQEIPADTMQITSGLGQSKPRQLLIAPLEISGRIIGVLELATLSQFTPEHQAFITRSAESIAIAVQTAQTRERIAALLLGSQRQAEELRTQEEELRAANDERQAQNNFSLNR